jgi:hypothetical protein
MPASLQSATAARREDAARRTAGAAIRAAFFALWAEAEELASRSPPYIRCDSVMVNGSEPQSFQHRVVDADMLPPCPAHEHAVAYG